MATKRRGASSRDEVYADNAMTWLLGDHPKARLLTVFVGKEYRDLTAERICTLAGIRHEEFEEHVDDLIDFGVVEVAEATDERTYRLNPESDLAADLKELQFDLLSAVAESDD